MGRNFGFFNVRDAIRDWLKNGEVQTFHMIKLWNQTDEQGGFRNLIIHSAVEYAFRKDLMDKMEVEFEENGPAELLEAWMARRKAKEAWAERGRRARDGITGSKDDSGKRRQRQGAHLHSLRKGQRIDGLRDRHGREKHFVKRMEFELGFGYRRPTDIGYLARLGRIGILCT